MTSKEVRDIIDEKVIGVWIPQHDDQGHHYTNGKVLLDSVTTKNILPKGRLIPWATRLAVQYVVDDRNRYESIVNGDEDVMKAAVFQYADVRDEAGSVGSDAHDAIELYVKAWIKEDKQPEDIRLFLESKADPRSFAAARAGEQVFVKKDVEPLATEIIVGSEKLKGAGTLDMLVMVDGEIELWDWKSSNNVNDFYACQVAAYKMFFEEMTGLTIARCRIFKLDKFSDRFKEYIVPNEDKAFEAYQRMAEVYDWFHDGTPKLEIYKKKLKL